MRAGSDKVIERRPVGEQVTDIIRRMIISGELLPGERLVGKYLAERIGISRTPVREALHRLAQENLVVRRQTGGYQVRPLSAREVEEVVGVRAALEGYGVELAAARMTPKALDALRANVEAFAQALQRRDFQRLVALNTQFHEAIYQAAGSNLLRSQITQLSEVLFRFRVALLSDDAAAARSLEDHRRLLEALARGEAETARRISREHILAGGQWILSRMRDQEEAGEQHG